MGRGSKIFIIAFLISACVFGLISFSVVSALTKLSAPIADPSELANGAVVNANPTVKGRSFNLLLINVDFRPEKSSYNSAKVNALFGNGYSVGSAGKNAEIEMLSAVLVRLDLEREEFTFTQIPAKTYVKINGAMEFLSSVYEGYGAASLCDQIHLITGITVDEYAVVIPSAAESIADMLGGLEYNLISSVSANDEKTVKSGNRLMSGEEIRTLLLGDYSGLATTREQVACELSKAFFAALSNGGEAAAKERALSFVSKLQTSLDADRISQNSGLLAAYLDFSKKELSLCGEYENGCFWLDVSQTIDKFSDYRKYYA